MDCKKCGTSLEENDQFCKNCGAPVNQVSAQTTYGPAPKNSTLKFVLIFLGIAIIVAAVIICVTIFTGDKEDDDDDDRKSSKKKTEIFAEDDEDEYDDYDFDEYDDYDFNDDYDFDEYEDDELSDEPSIDIADSTYTVKSNGFTFKIPTNLVYQTQKQNGLDVIVIGDEYSNWVVTITPIQGAYNQLLKNINQIQSAITQQGYTASVATVKNIAGRDFITLEASAGGKNMLMAYTKANSMYLYTLVALNMGNEFDYNLLETVTNILDTAEFDSEATNMETDKEIDYGIISDLAKE